KTGTLTLGKPALNGIQPTGTLTADECLRVAGSLDHHSAHPVARAVVQAWQRKDATASLLDVVAFESLHGLGVKGTIDGQIWHLGNRRLAEQLSHASPQVIEALNIYEQKGQTALILMNASGAQAL